MGNQRSNDRRLVCKRREPNSLERLDIVYYKRRVFVSVHFINLSYINLICYKFANAPERIAISYKGRTTCRYSYGEC